MGLSKKTFFYSMILALILVVFAIGYFVFMLPSLYVDYMVRSNLDSVIEVQKEYLANRSYDNITVKNPSSVYSLEIPKKGQSLFAAGKFIKLEMEITDKDLQEFLNEFRDIISSFWTQKDSEELLKDFSEENSLKLSAFWKDLEETIKEEGLFSKDTPIKVQIEGKERIEGEGIYQKEYSKVHIVSEKIAVYQAGVSDKNYSYTTYLAMGQTEDAFILTVFPTMTPQMEEIMPIVMGSIPMITAIVFLLVFIASHFFSGKIVNPIIKLANYAENAKEFSKFPISVFHLNRKDEIGILGRNLQELYDTLEKNYRELEQKNNLLKEENKRQEVFLRASSHQLKTPVTAALLLIDGMINEIGKYKNVKQYLPEVKKQLQAMQKIIGDVMCLNIYTDTLQKEILEVIVLIKELVKAYSVQIEEKNLDIVIQGNGKVITDLQIFKKLVDNLLSNAVQYTQKGGKIEIEIKNEMLCIKNYSEMLIEETLLPHIFEPFVSSDKKKKGKGLGLYIASYYSRLLGYQLEIKNGENYVIAIVIFMERGKENATDNKTITSKIWETDSTSN